RGAKNFEELKMVNDITCATFKESAQHRGFLENDNEHRLLAFGDITDMQQLWNKNFDAMAEDFAYKGILEGQHQIQAVLQSLNIFLQRHIKTVNDYDLPELLQMNTADLPRTILEELSYHITQEDLDKANILNEA
ncbi:592_t:CDS:2, partial [Cetraspora pellucida]